MVGQVGIIRVRTGAHFSGYRVNQELAPATFRWQFRYPDKYEKSRNIRWQLSTLLFNFVEELARVL